MKVLIVEDDPNLRLLWRTVLRERGDEVADAEDTRSAALALRGGSFEAIVLDLYLGREDGASLIRLAEETNPGSKVIIVTGCASVPRQELFNMSPLVAAVHWKPLDIEDLLDSFDQLEAAAGPAEPVRWDEFSGRAI